MRARLDTLMIVRRVAAREAGVDLARAAGDVAHQALLVSRIDMASSALVPDCGLADGASLAAQLEFSQRMRVARSQAEARIAESRGLRDEAAVARKSARRALDAVIDVKRAARRTGEAQREARVVPVRVER
jgi:hypothetical protein